MKEMDEFQQFAEELEDEEFMDDLEEYDEDIEDEEDTELKISDLTEEELQALQLLQELASVSEKLWNAHIAKLLEYNKTHEVKMKEETVTIEDGETYIVYSAYLPDEKEQRAGREDKKCRLSILSVSTGTVSGLVNGSFI